MSNGCAKDQAVILRGVNFELNSAQLTMNAETILNGVAETLVSSPGFEVELQGHTDSTGSDSYNMNLSQNRAKSVKSYLVSSGVEANRLTARGYGEEQPIASNDTKVGRAENRRVELKVVGDNSDVSVEPMMYDEPMVEEPMLDEPMVDEVMMEDPIMDEEPAAEAAAMEDDYMSEEPVVEDEYEYEYDASEETDY
jgi:OOP family OmpA-OmpF porin